MTYKTILESTDADQYRQQIQDELMHFFRKFYLNSETEFQQLPLHIIEDLVKALNESGRGQPNPYTTQSRGLSAVLSVASCSRDFASAIAPIVREFIILDGTLSVSDIMRIQELGFEGHPSAGNNTKFGYKVIEPQMFVRWRAPSFYLYVVHLGNLYHVSLHGTKAFEKTRTFDQVLRIIKREIKRLS